MTGGSVLDDYPNIPPHIRAWLQTEDGWQTVTQIVLDAVNDTTNVITNAEVREIVEEAYRRRRPRPAAGREPEEGSEG